MRSFFLLALVSTFACVSIGDHDALKSDLAASALASAGLEKELDAEKDKTRELKTSLDDQDRQATAQKEQTDAIEKTLRGEIQHLQGDLAQIVKDRAALKGSVNDMKQALDELGKRKEEADRRIAEFKGLLSRFKSLIDAGKLRVKIVDGRMVVALASDILFSSGSASLSKDGKASIAEVARLLAQIPDKKFQVEGHTDNVPIRTEQFPSNWELASARALTVVKTMVDAGLVADRVSAASFADKKPSAPNDTAEGRAQNRRIEIVVVPDLSSLPGFDELSRAGS